MSEQQPLFTIATITYNSGKWVRQAIESVLASSFTDFELLISDDCSTDDTWEIIQQYNDPRIRAWRNEKNMGEYPNRNKVLQQAKGKYILYVDGDDILYKDTLRNLSEYISAFPGAGMFWGLNPQHFPFFIFPYQVLPRQNMKLIYCTLIPIAEIGFGEVLFDKASLLKIGGFSTKYKTGDTFIKKKLAMMVPVVYVNIGFMFWRQSPQQASKLVTKGFKGFMERVSIDNTIINDPDFPCTDADKELIVTNLKISRIKLAFSATILKGNLIEFFRYLNRLKIPFSDCKYLFKKGDYRYSPAVKLEEPLSNDYHINANS